MKQFIRYGALLATTVYLVGCGGGSGSNNTQPESNAKTIVKIGNETPFNFASAIVQSSTGTVYYEGAFNCAKSDTNCYLNLMQDINESVTILFKDSNGRVVEAVIVADAPGTYISLYPNGFSTGFYLVTRLAEELKASNDLSWLAVNDRVQTFFTNYDSPDGTLDPYEEVGDYYTSQLIKGVASESAFIAAFKQRLLNWDIAEASELPVPGAQFANLYDRILAFFRARDTGLINYAVAQEAGCGAGLSTFLNFAENLASIIPVVGDAVSGAAAIGNSYCDGTDAKLDQIMSQLNNLQDSVNNVDRNVGAIASFLSDAAANAKTTELQKLATDVKNLSAQYKRFLMSKGAKTLQEYFTHKGGWDAAIKDGGSALDNLLGAAYKDRNSSNLFPKISHTTDLAEFDTYLNALNLRCKTPPTTSNDNFVLTRQQCNNIIQANSGRLVAAQGMLLPIVKDVYSVLNTYKAQAELTYLLPSEIHDYASAYTDIRTAFNQQQTNMVNSYKSRIGSLGYFNAFEGLNAELLDHLAGRQCEQSGRDRVKGPAIVGWYQLSSNKTDQYIETNCKMGTASQRIKARYYYAAQNGSGSNVNANDVANVLGVPVAFEYIRNAQPLFNSDANDSLHSLESSYGIQEIAIEASQLIKVGTGRDNVIIAYDNLGLKKVSDGNWTEESRDALYYGLIKLQNNSYYTAVRLGRTIFPNSFWLGCVAANCRVDPRTGEWLIFNDGKSDRETLDFTYANKQDPEGRNVYRLAPAGK